MAFPEADRKPHCSWKTSQLVEVRTSLGLLVAVSIGHHFCCSWMLSQRARQQTFELPSLEALRLVLTALGSTLWKSQQEWARIVSRVYPEAFRARPRSIVEWLYIVMLPMHAGSILSLKSQIERLSGNADCKQMSLLVLGQRSWSCDQVSRW